MSSRFFTALLGRQAQCLFGGPQPRYFRQAFAAHLATLCRMYNDYGSAARDAEKETLNCLDFGEFELHNACLHGD